jgi:hypothetical protein
VTDITHEAVYAWLCAAYPDKDIPPETATVYRAHLGDIDPDCLMAAADEHIDACKWFPTVHELKERCKKLAPQYERVMHPAEAWRVAQNALVGAMEGSGLRFKDMPQPVQLAMIKAGNPEPDTLHNGRYEEWFLTAYKEITAGLRYHPPHGSLGTGEGRPRPRVLERERQPPA